MQLEIAMGYLRYKNVISVTCVIVFFIGTGVYIFKQNCETAIAAHQTTLANAVDTLPPGVENVWLAYVDRRVAATIKRDGNVVDVVQMVDIVTGTSDIVSITTPFSISCDVYLGASVQFGYGDDAVTASVIDPFGIKDVDSTVETQPHLGVSTSSIAAKHLSKDICQRIAVDVSSIMIQQQKP
jgi:hypothetical protein